MPDRSSIHRQSILPPLRALFQQRVEGDDALLQLARLRFAQAGLAAEVYADTPEQLDQVLGFVPSHRRLPVVHLSRGVDVLQAQGRAVVEAFAARFAGRVWALVVHDKAEMVTPSSQASPTTSASSRRLSWLLRTFVLKNGKELKN